MNKAREFWVDPESMDDQVGIYDTFDKHPGQGPLQWQDSLIHVIEKSAYDKAVADLDALQAKYSQAMTDWSADAIKKTQRIVELEAEVTRLREKYDFQQLIKRDEEQKAEIARLREALDSILAPFDCMNCEMSGAYERKICSEHIEDNQRVAEEALNFKPKTATSADLGPKTKTAVKGGG